MKLRSLLAPGAVLCSLLAMSMPTSAADTNDPEDAASPYGPGITIIATERGITNEQQKADMNARRSADRILSAINTRNDYAGGWTEWLSGGGVRVHILQTDTALQAAASQVATDAPIVYDTVKYSRNTLIDIATEIAERFATQAQIGLDTPNNKVAVRLYLDDGKSAPTADDARQTLIDKYGEDLLTFSTIDQADSASDNCSATNDYAGESRYNCTPWRSGISLQRTPFTESDHCSFMFLARNGAATKQFVVTAAHCGDPFSDNVTLYHHNVQIGTTGSSDGTHTSIEVDARKVQIASSSNWDTEFADSVYQGEFDHHHYIDGEIQFANQLNNDVACKTGVGIGTWFGNACGHIYDDACFWDPDWWPGTHTIFGACADFNDGSSGDGIAGGDSGALVWDGDTRIMGLAANTVGFYSPSSFIETELSLVWCFGHSCGL